AIAAAEARDQIEILGDVSDADLDRLYRSAIAVVLPSTYEGFGFTSLEAMSRGCPVLASDIAALREVSGSGAELLRLGDEDAWAAAIRRVVSDEGFRAELRARDEALPRCTNSASATKRVSHPSSRARQKRSRSSAYMKRRSAKPPRAAQAASRTAMTAPVAAWTGLDCP